MLIIVLHSLLHPSLKSLHSPSFFHSSLPLIFFPSFLLPSPLPLSPRVDFGGTVAPLFSLVLSKKIGRSPLERMFSFGLGGGGGGKLACALLKFSRPLYLYFLDQPLILPPFLLCSFLLSFLHTFLPSLVTFFLPILFLRFDVRSLEFRRSILRCTFRLVNKMIQFWNTNLICKNKKETKL